MAVNTRHTPYLQAAAAAAGGTAPAAARHSTRPPPPPARSCCPRGSGAAAGACPGCGPARLCPPGRSAAPSPALPSAAACFSIPQAPHARDGRLKREYADVTFAPALAEAPICNSSHSIRTLSRPCNSPPQHPGPIQLLLLLACAMGGGDRLRLVVRRARAAPAAAVGWLLPLLRAAEAAPAGSAAGW